VLSFLFCVAVTGVAYCSRAGSMSRTCLVNSFQMFVRKVFCLTDFTRTEVCLLAAQDIINNNGDSCLCVCSSVCTNTVACRCKCMAHEQMPQIRRDSDSGILLLLLHQSAPCMAEAHLHDHEGGLLACRQKQC
jgi:hypothetical protein